MFKLPVFRVSEKKKEINFTPNFGFFCCCVIVVPLLLLLNCCCIPPSWGLHGELV